jgi:hypothetical protein
MKKLLALLIAGAFIVPAIAEEKPKTEKKCIMQKDAKTGKEKEVCKTIKKHEKHEGTAVPEDKKKK